MRRYGRLEIDGSGRLALFTAGGITRYTYDRLSALPEYCQKAGAARLPNGWRLELSNQVCEAADGHVYEGIGIPPQVEVPVFIPGNIYPGLKLAVDKAVALAERAIAKRAVER